MRRLERITRTASTTEGMRRIGAQLASLVPKVRIFTFTGALGAGKTTCIQGFGEALGISKNLISPTYTIIHEYPLSKDSLHTLVHIDLYRIVHENEVAPLGIHDWLTDPGAVVLVEWADRHPELFQNLQCVSVTIEFVSTSRRKITITRPV
jgi:tRNA threonylcarbamoyladenosine biosynthesis protein TsaE